VAARGPRRRAAGDGVGHCERQHAVAALERQFGGAGSVARGVGHRLLCDAIGGAIDRWRQSQLRARAVAQREVQAGGLVALDERGDAVDAGQRLQVGRRAIAQSA
jgi:hypothetical protein